MKSAFLNLALFLLPFLAFSEDYIIDNYYVNIEVMPDGSLQVIEEIEVNFATPKHGIIRTIPNQYHISYLPDSLKSLRAEPSNTYFIKIYDIEVDNFESNSIENYHNIQIRIGSADKFVSGKQKYTIKYKISGIINPFNNFDELTWNIIGNQWDVPINAINFEIKFNKHFQISAEDILIVTGLETQKNKDASFEIKDKVIYGKSTKPFSPKEGISLAIKFPKKYFENNYNLTKFETKIVQNYNGSCTITDKIDMNFKNYQNGFIYQIPKKFEDKLGKIHQIYIKEVRFLNHNIYKIKEKENFYEIHIGGTTASPMLKGKNSIEFNYETWGNVFEENNSSYLFWQFFSIENKNDSTECKYVVSSSEKNNFQQNKIKLQNLTQTTTNSKIEGKIISSKNKNTNIFIELPKNSTGYIAPIDVIKEATNFYIKKIDVKIKIESNKQLHLNQKMQLEFINSTKKGSYFPFTYNITKSFFENENIYLPARYIKTSRKAFFTKQYKPYYSAIQLNDANSISDYDNEMEISWKAMEENTKSANYNLSFSIYDIINRTDSGSIISIPILTNITEPVLNTECIFEFPAAIKKNDIVCKLLRNDTLPTNLEFVISGNKVIISIPFLKKEKTPFAISIRFPNDLINKSSYYLEFKLFLLNNYILLIPVFVFLCLSIIWLILGKNKRQTIITQYEAPEGVTPAEAGFLWDNKLHKRDMVSLFFYWAAKKHIKIIINENEKIQFKLLQKLSKDAKAFEKSIFNKIFKTTKIGETVVLDTFIGSFSNTLKKAFRQMRTYSKNNKFYTPGTLGFGRFLVVISLFAFSGSILFFISDLYFNQLVISQLLLGIILFTFGKIMPKRAHWGDKIYNQLLGFAEFIETAELDRLKKLSDENPDYFANTLAFAIVMGKAEKWAQKFEPIFNSLPSWYQSDTIEKSARTFTASIIKSMYQTENILTYITPSSSRSSSSSFSTSSSSWSGSSSFSSSSSSSFSSGSGFGGGGGSSW